MRTHQYNQRMFSDIFKNPVEFVAAYNNCGIPTTIDEDHVKLTYYLLMTKYGFNPIGTMADDYFITQLMMIIWRFGPAWVKKLEIQTAMRNVSLDDVVAFASGVNINNESLNPSAAPTTDTMDVLPTVNRQYSSKFKSSKLDALNKLWASIENDVSEDYIRRFENLFLSIVLPQNVLLFSDDEEGDEE